MGILKSITRISSFLSKELVEVFRRPGAFLSLVLGPFLVMAIFGIGYNGVRRPMQAVLVIPQGSSLAQDAEAYRDFTEPAIHVVEITPDAAAAEQRLRERTIDLVVIAPPDLETQFRAGQQSKIRVLYNQIDPILTSYADFLAYRLTNEVNNEILRRAVAGGQQYAVTTLGAAEVTQIPPDTIANPTTAEPVNISETPPNVLNYFAPAVFALILQHMAVTLSALSLVRERLGGAMEVFRVSPATTIEILLGKYLGFGLLALAIGGILLALLVLVFRVPFLGSPQMFVATVLLLTFASLGVGLLISAIADSERQAVQLSMLVLLASVFFSGFVLPIEEFRPEVRTAAYALPVTNGIRLLQDVMLRGTTQNAWQLGVLGGVGLVLFAITTVLLRRSMARH
jgi:ABC-2 type transport system permease protein